MTSSIQKGYFFGQYKTNFSDYVGLDYSKRVFVFSGQGSSYPGMMKDLFLKSSVIQSQFAITDVLMKKKGFRPSSDYIFNEADNLDTISTSEKNIALLTLQVGLFKLLGTLGIQPALLTGHSFGEYACLVCSGALQLEDAVDILISRDNEEFLNNLGEMLAVRCSYEQLLQLPNEDLFYISNINSNHQCVISTKPQHVTEVIKLFKSKSIPCIRLSIKYPYHCKLLEPALLSFSKFIDASKYRANLPSIPVLSSVNQAHIPMDKFSNEDLKTHLKNQMRNPVNFLKQIQILEQQGCINFIEMGPSKTLTDFISDIDSGRKVFRARTVQDVLPASLKNKIDTATKSSGKFLNLFSKALNFVTGYEIDNFTIKDRMQEDLGIDSIRKAEIIFKVLDDSGIKNSAQNQNVRISDLSTVDDVLQYFEHQYKSSLAAGAEQTSEFSTEYKFKKTDWKPRPLANFIKQLDSEQVVLNISYTNVQAHSEISSRIHDFLKLPVQQRKIIQVKFELNYEINPGYFRTSEKDLKLWISNVVHFFAELNLASFAKQNDVFFQFLFDTTKQHPAVLLLRSFLTSWGLEQSGIGCQIIELISSSLKSLTDEIVLNHSDGNAIYIRYVENLRYVESAVDEDHKDQNGNLRKDELKPFRLKRGSHVVIVGGHSGIGWEITQSLDPDLDLKVVLVGRKLAADADVVQKIQQLKNKNLDCEYFSSDARNEDLFLALIAKIIEKNGPISLLVNTVGIVINKVLIDCPRDLRLMELETKAEAISNISKAFLKFEIGHVISFSSSTGYFGNTGQAVYALANSYVDMVSQLFDRFENRGRFQSIRWPPWDKVGFITENSPIQSFINFIGLTYLSRTEGVSFFWKCLNQESSSINILDDNSYIRYYASGVDRKAFRQFLPSMQTPLIGRHLNLSGLTLLNLPYLRDHCLSGKPIVAASNMIALFMQLGYAIWGKVPQALDFLGHNFIFVDETESKINLNVDRTDESISFQLKTSFLHSEGKVQDLKTPLQKMNKQIPKYNHKLDAASLRGTIIETIRSFEYTDLFWVEPDEKKLLIEFNLSELPRCTEMPLYDRLFAMIEICNQAVGLVAQWKTNQYSIPKSIQAVTVFDQTLLTEKMFSQQENVRITDADVTADAYITNEFGEVVMYLKDIMFANLNQPASASERFKPLRI